MALVAAAALAGLLAIWVVYPLVIVVLSWLRGVPRGSDDGAARISVIIATRDDAVAIRDRVSDCLGADVDAGRVEVVVAIDSRGTGVRLSDLSGLEPRVTAVLGDEPGGKAPTLNAAVRAARGDILVFTDTHQRFEADTIRHLVVALGAERVGVVSGRLDLPTNGGSRSLVQYYWLYERWLRRHEARVHSTVGVTGAVYAMRRALWRPLPVGLLLDDLYTPMQAVLRGYRVGFEERARAIDTRQSTPEQEYRRKVRTLTGVIQLCAWLPAVLAPVRNPIWLQFVCHKLLRLLTPYLLLALVLGGVGTLLRPLGADAVWPLAVLLLLGGFALALVAEGRRYVSSMLRWAVALQAATVVATFNGLRGRWDVWQK